MRCRLRSFVVTRKSIDRQPVLVNRFGFGGTHRGRMRSYARIVYVWQRLRSIIVYTIGLIIAQQGIRRDRLDNLWGAADAAARQEPRHLEREEAGKEATDGKMTADTQNQGHGPHG